MQPWDGCERKKKEEDESLNVSERMSSVLTRRRPTFARCFREAVGSHLEGGSASLAWVPLLPMRLEKYMQLISCAHTNNLQPQASKPRRRSDTVFPIFCNLLCILDEITRLCDYSCGMRKITRTAICTCVSFLLETMLKMCLANSSTVILSPPLPLASTSKSVDTYLLYSTDAHACCRDKCVLAMKQSQLCRWSSRFSFWERVFDFSI